ncbi:MAG: tRNA (5-methylaminomethyl-2-thiouridine)(34)-methyltransferase MnmD [Bacteroidia bacterium]|nr:tRNA (5-methylaminomethyl-2-thiouridine)(34)-methyltransferase MnmD [Bacteroidia bacterium]
MSTVRLVDTGDGSHSLRNDALNENYHSWHGAVTESRYVFVEAGVKEAFLLRDRIRVLEVGHGTGLNAALSLGYAREQGLALDYAGLEPFPVPAELLRQINYPSFFTDAEKDAFAALTDASWDQETAWGEQEHFIKIERGVQADFQGLLPAEWMPFDLVFYDAFGPEKQTEMWDKAIWKTCFDLLREGGIFVTYCAKGQVKRDLREAGFTVETLPGPPGKREMIRARKLPQNA